jgi:hypothetical protein
MKAAHSNQFVNWDAVQHEHCSCRCCASVPGRIDVNGKKVVNIYTHIARRIGLDVEAHHIKEHTVLVAYGRDSRERDAICRAALVITETATILDSGRLFGTAPCVPTGLTTCGYSAPKSRFRWGENKCMTVHCQSLAVVPDHVRKHLSVRLL